MKFVSQHEAMKFRSDIQCLRGIAIISVLFYHLYPSIFENGYLGVDMFFVVSGYLMARNLTNSKIESVHDILEFYYKRFKRILPTYYLVIFVVVVAIHHFFFEFWWETNYRYSFASLFCITNQLIIHDSGDYFTEFLADGTSLNAFIHLWSLGVEMQFYLLVPFIFYGFQILKYDVLKLVASILITVVSACAFILIDPQFAFNFMFLRLWQFSAGLIALFLSKLNIFEAANKLKTEKMRKGLEEDVTCVALSVLLLCFIPVKIEARVSRPLITGIMIYLLYVKDLNNKILSSNLLSYIGDLSYIIYLVHWPIITMCGGITFKARLLSLVATLIISVLIHHIYEKWYLKESMKVVIILIFSLMLLNGGLQFSIRNNKSVWRQKYSEDLTEIIKQNRAFLPFHWETQPRAIPCEKTTFESHNNVQYDFGYCKYPKGNGKLKVLVIGNSYTLNFGEEIRSTFKNQNYSTFEMMPIGEGYGIYQDGALSTFALDIFKSYVLKTKPDILFIVSRYSKPVKAAFGNVSKDNFIKQFNENISFYERFVKHIFIMGPHPLYNLNFANYFMQYLTKKPDEIEDLQTSKKDADIEMMYIKKRFKDIECQKCEVFDLGHKFAKDDKYLSFDREKRLSYIDNTAHLTTAGLEVVRPVLENITDTILRTF